MDAERNKLAIRRLFEIAWNEQNFEELPHLLVPDYAVRERIWAEGVLAADSDTQIRTSRLKT